MGLQIRVYRQRSLQHSMPLTGLLQIGRQRPGEPDPIYFNSHQERLIIADLNDKLVSRKHLQLETVTGESNENLAAARIRITNLSRKRSVLVEPRGRLRPEQELLVKTPTQISFEDFTLRIGPTDESDLLEVRSLETPTLAPGQIADNLELKTQQTFLQASIAEAPPPDKLMHWLSEMMVVLQHAAATEDFLSQAVDAVDRIVGLDVIMALRLEGDEWSIEAAKRVTVDDSTAATHSPSLTILLHMVEQRSTVFHLPAALQGSASLEGVKALVASPILDSKGEVIGALYGARFSSPKMQIPQISELEATLVEVIACSAAAGIARQQQQQEALQAKILFEQYFSPQLARELEANPQMLDAQEAEISVLFCDIVGFSAVSHRIGSHLTMQWISHVMEYLSDAVEDNAGVVVDYIGDELMAMWGAPKAEKDHAINACLAAQALFSCRAPIDDDWLEQTKQQIDFRIGICSGTASVGNTGSIRRLKYGPLGNTVNLASRLQTAAKQFGVTQVVSAATAAEIQNHSSLICRPLGTARFVNIDQPLEVYELGSRQLPEFEELCSRFLDINLVLKAARWDQAQQLLQETAARFPQDQPTLHLLRRLEEPEALDPDCLWPFEKK